MMIDDPITVGYRALAVFDDAQGARVPLHVLYPARAPARTLTFGPYAIDAAPDAPLAADRPLPVVTISHGTGGTPWSYRGLAAHLARAGVVVALVAHPGNTRGDNELADTPANLANRPRHLRLALDAVLADAALGSHRIAGRAAVIGHSLGGYTALAAAGGRPTSMPDQHPDHVARPVPVEPDPRVAAVVLLAPALPWFLAPGALAGVRAPILVRTGERDPLAPPGFVAHILRGLPDGARLDDQVVPGAGHFAFVTQVPPALVSPDFPPSQDPPGFDRAAYLPALYAEVTAFVRATLA